MNASIWINARYRTIFCKILILIVLFIAPVNLQGIVYGSNTATAIESFVTFPQTGTDNTMLGFGSFSNGFGLASAQTTCTFNDFYPVSTPMVLNGGTLYLKEDLFLDSQLVISSLGTIAGNRHCITFEAQTQPILFPSPGTLNQVSTQNAGNSVNWVEWSQDSNYLAVATNAQGGSNTEIKIYSLSPTFTLTLAAGAHLGLNVYNVRWRPGTSPYYLAAATNSGVYAYHFTPPNSLVATSTIGTGTDFPCAVWHPSGNAIALGRPNTTTQSIMIYNFNALSGTLTYTASYSSSQYMVTYSHRALDFDYTGSYLAAGFYGGGNRLQVFSWDGTTLTPVISIDPNVTYYVAWSPDGSSIAVAPTNNATTLLIYSFNRNTQSLVQIPSYNTTFPVYIQWIDWSPDGNNIVVGLNSTSESLALCAVNRVAQTLLCTGQYNLGGIIYAAKWSPNQAYLAVGNYTTYYASVYNFLPGAMTFSNANIVFNSPVQLRAPVSFSGTCIIDGNGYPLDLNSQIVTVTAGASVLFNNVVLKGIAGTNLQCFDSSGTVSLRDVTCIVNNAMQWRQGQLAILGDCIMTGSGTFIYSSNQASTISSHAQWYFDRGLTFSYYPPGGNTNLINFADSSAQLYLYAASLHVASTGLHLTKGCLMIDGPCQFLSDSANEATGIWIGDGTAADDLKVKILAESGIIVGQGYVSYRNTK